MSIQCTLYSETEKEYFERLSSNEMRFIKISEVSPGWKNEYVNNASRSINNPGALSLLQIKRQKQKSYNVVKFRM